MCFGCCGAAGAITSNNRILTDKGVRVRLAPLPSLGFTAQESPFPRGELMVNSPNQFLGYLGSPKATADSLDAEGFYR